MITVQRWIFLSIIGVLISLTTACQLQKGMQTDGTFSGAVLADMQDTPGITVLDTSDYTQLTPPPENMSTDRATVYLESIQKIKRPDTTFLLIRGNFSNGCSHLKSLSHTIKGSVLHLEIEAWQPKDRMCTQVLTPFSYLYKKLSAKQVEDLRSYMIRGKKKSF